MSRVKIRVNYVNDAACVESCAKNQDEVLMLRIKNSLNVIGLACSLVMLGAGCATNVYPGGPTVSAVCYANVTSPAQMLSVATDANARLLKTGHATSRAIMGVAAMGDGGLDAAMKNGGITKVHHVDHNVKLIFFGVYVRDTVIVHGE